MPSASSTLDGRAWVLLLTLASLWGGSFLFVGVAVREVGPVTVAALRVGLALPVLVLLALPALRRLRRRDLPIGALIVMGLLNNVLPFALTAWAQTRMTSGMAATVNATTPFLTILVAPLFGLIEARGRQRLGGILCGIAGVALAVRPWDGAAGADPAGVAAGVLAALSYALAAAHARRSGLGALAPAVAALGMVAAATLVLVPAAMMIETPVADLAAAGSAARIAIPAVALIGTAAAYPVYFRLLALAGPANLLLVTLLMPMIAILAGAVVLGEVVAPVMPVGLALVALGLAMVDGRLFQRKRPRHR
ncbi:MAG: EamA family transporter [Tistrella sp.]|uniref:EamA family transporter n=1 Tax=Tistrella mobilis TaxID=171437 RepID=A0A3B9IGN0_9PROT|nr:DMT family transporter [Tistrella sp.]MAD39417.1 EamA family transporter [Tistrella sp.]MBA76433.1 EamA family transporter [Tistrella sp.]HAE47024.1 EamA family transporter [Tistrella mobilis]